MATHIRVFAGSLTIYTERCMKQKQIILWSAYLAPNMERVQVCVLKFWQYNLLKCGNLFHALRTFNMIRMKTKTMI